MSVDHTQLPTAREMLLMPRPELVLEITVYGTPATQGSKVAGVGRDGHRFVREDNPDLKRWRTQIAGSVGSVYTGGILDEAIGLDLTFYRPRPATHYLTGGGLNAHGRRHPYPDVTPDLTKLERAVEDALKDIVYTNDSRIVDKRTRKRWGSRACVRIKIFKLAQL